LFIFGDLCENADEPKEAEAEQGLGDEQYPDAAGHHCERCRGVPRAGRSSHGASVVRHKQDPRVARFFAVESREELAFPFGTAGAATISTRGTVISVRWRVS